MNFNHRGVLAVGLAGAVLSSAFAADGGEASSDEEMQNEISYVEALLEARLPSFAEDVIEATKKKWPESETALFALEIRGLLSQLKYDEAEAMIAALPTRDGSKYWAARIEVANHLFRQGKKKDAEQIYKEFFKKYSGKPPKELRLFYIDACYNWGYTLSRESGRHDEALKTLEGLHAILNPKSDQDEFAWQNVGCDIAELCVRIAEDKPRKERKPYLDKAKKYVKPLLYLNGIMFGRAVAVLAKSKYLEGDTKGAQETINDYMTSLAKMHEEIIERDPEGKKGELRMSPMPMCRYLIAQILWDAAQAEAKKTPFPEESVKSLLFGELVPNGKGKRTGSGAYNHAANVFLRYPESAWAMEAADMVETINAFCEKRFGKVPSLRVTEEQKANLRAKKFEGARVSFAEGEFRKAFSEYDAVLPSWPEGEESVVAIENMAMCHLNLIALEGGKMPEAERESRRIDVDAMEGYLAERFAGHRDRAVMTAAGNAVCRLAGVEKERGEAVRAFNLFKLFVTTYRRHLNAPRTAASLAVEAAKDGRFDDAVEMWQVIGNYYTNSAQYATSLSGLSSCLDKKGDREGAIAAMKKYCEVEEAPLRRTQGQMQLANLYLKTGIDAITNIAEDASAELREAKVTEGSRKIAYAIKEFKGFAAFAEAQLADPMVSQGDKKDYGELRETALFLIGDCWRRITKPESRLETCRKNAVAAFEAYVEQYPKGKYAKGAYILLSTINTALGNMEKSKDALDKLAKYYPDSDEAKNAKPRLAKSLIDMGMVKEGTEVYAEMLKTDGKYTPGQLVNAGEALITARSWDLADRAFAKAMTLAKDKGSPYYVAKSRIGKAKALFAQKAYAEARNQIDDFLADKKMSKMGIAADAYLLMVEVASDQGRRERDDGQRTRHFNAAVGAVKKLRTYWKDEPKFKRDSIDLMSVDVMMRRIQAEDDMGLREQALDSCRTTAGMLQKFHQSHGPDEAHPFASMSQEEKNNLERCYSRIVPLFARLGAEQADRVLEFGQLYLEYFPNGPARAEVVSCMNTARSVLPQSGDAPAKPAAQPAAAPQAPAAKGQAESTDKAEGVKTDEK